MATPQETQDLKQDWESDPCWDIEDTEGFEEHKDELLAFRLEKEKEWEQIEQERVAQRCKEFNCTPETLTVIELFEYQIKELNAKIECICERNNLSMYRWWDFKE